MLKKILIIFSLFVLSSCGAGKIMNNGDLEANLRKLIKFMVGATHIDNYKGPKRNM